MIARLMWFIRRWFWNLLALFKAMANKPLVIPLPKGTGPDGVAIVPVPLSQAVDGLLCERVQAALQRDIPADERQPSKTLFYRLQVWLYRAFSPMQAGLPPISSDPRLALKRAYSALHRRKFPAPCLPAEFLGSPDLGALAVRGPYACYTHRLDGQDGAFGWNLQMLSRYEHHAQLCRLGVAVRFAVDAPRRALVATHIDCELGTVSPGEPHWEQAKKIALCAATTHLSLVRHFNWVHLAGGSMLAIATRNRLSAGHALMRLMFPYIYGTQQSNDMVTRGQMLRGGDFDTVFSLSFEGQCRLFDDTWGDFDIVHNDPAEDARRRGVLDAGFDTPTERNLGRLFELMLDHARRYLRIYWPDDAALARDEAVRAWIDELNRLLPNGAGVTGQTLTLDTLARLVARCIYLVSAQHELLGSFVWNYQLWTHRQPVRVYANGQAEPLDVYQRLVNANFNLNVTRRMLDHDFSYLALDPQGGAEMQRFGHALHGEQQQMQQRPWAVWKLYPAVLKANINA